MAADDAKLSIIDRKASLVNAMAEGTHRRIQVLEAEDMILLQRSDNIVPSPDPKGNYRSLSQGGRFGTDATASVDGLNGNQEPGRSHGSLGIVGAAGTEGPALAIGPLN